MRKMWRLAWGSIRACFPLPQKRGLTLAWIHFLMEICVDEPSKPHWLLKKCRGKKENSQLGKAQEVIIWGTCHLQKNVFDDWDSIDLGKEQQMLPRRKQTFSSRAIMVGLDGVGQNTPTISHLSANLSLNSAKHDLGVVYPDGCCLF